MNNNLANLLRRPICLVSLFKPALAAILCFCFLTLLVFGPGVGNAQAKKPFTQASVEEISKAVQAYKGKVVVMSVFASWCPPCVEEAPVFVDFYAKYPPESGVQLLGISLDEDPAALTKFIHDKGIKYPVYLGGQDFISYFNIQTIPTLIVVDRSGEVVEYLAGMATVKEIVKLVKKYQ